MQPLLAALIAHVVFPGVLFWDVACEGARALQVWLELLARLVVRVLICCLVGQAGQKFIRLRLIVSCLIFKVRVDEIICRVHVIFGILRRLLSHFLLLDCMHVSHLILARVLNGGLCNYCVLRGALRLLLRSRASFICRIHLRVVIL